MSGAFVVINCKSLSIKGMAIVNQIYVSNICTERERKKRRVFRTITYELTIISQIHVQIKDSVLLIPT